MEKIMTEMHSVLMGNKAVDVPDKTKDINSGQKRAPSFAHFDGFKQWSVSTISISASLRITMSLKK
eukprot:598771-Ditylum_brightwellii.AAC.1